MSEDDGGGAQPTVLLAGWLFADLAVGLVIILLATATDAPVRAAEPTGSPTGVPSPVLSPTRSPTPAVDVGMEQEPLVFRVQSDASALLGDNASEVAEVVDAIREELEPYEEDGRKAGVVLTFGGSSDPGEGVALAAAANEVFRAAAPEFVETAAFEDYWAAAGRDGVTRGTLEFKIFVFVEG